MDNNVIVMTTGLSGSSVTTALVAKSGYWLGDNTIVKDNSSGHYDTYENEKLVEMNEKLFTLLGIENDYSNLYKQDVFDKFAEAHQKIDLTPFKEFIEECNAHGSWLWKDPRLWMTIGFWLPLLEAHSNQPVKFVVLSRDPLSMWVSLLVKRRIVNYGFLKRSELGTAERLKRHLSSRNHDFVLVNYNDLTTEPAPVIAELNGYIGGSLDHDDFLSIYNGPLPAPKWTTKNLIKAFLIYIKNINEAEGK